MKKLKISLASFLATISAVFIAVVTLTPGVFAAPDETGYEQALKYTYGTELEKKVHYNHIITEYISPTTRVFTVDFNTDGDDVEVNYSLFDAAYDTSEKYENYFLVQASNPKTMKLENVSTKFDYHITVGTHLDIQVSGSDFIHLFYDFGEYSISENKVVLFVTTHSEGDTEYVIPIFYPQLRVEISRTLDDTRPAISGNEHFASDVDNPTPVADFVNEIRAIDDIDGDISHLIVIENDDFTPNNTTVGTYAVDLSVTDLSGNRSDFTFHVHVADVTDPVVNGDFTERKVSYSQTLDINALKNSLTITDNYYQKSELDIVVTRDTYTANKTKLGLYHIDITVTDPSQNYTVVTFPVRVVDLVPPVINGNFEIEKSYVTIMTLQDILDGITANDEKDGNLTDDIVVVSDGFTGNSNRPGTYIITVKVSDLSNNTTTKDITVTVIDDVSPGWYITNGVTFNLPAGMEITRTQIIELLSKAGRVLYTPSSVITYQADTYSANVGTPGLYTLAFNVKQPSGVTNDYTFAINVMSGEDEDVDVIPPSKSFIDNIKDFFASIGTWFTENRTNVLIYGGVLIVGFLVVGAGISKLREQSGKNKNRRRRR